MCNTSRHYFMQVRYSSGAKVTHSYMTKDEVLTQLRDRMNDPAWENVVSWEISPEVIHA